MHSSGKHLYQYLVYLFFIFIAFAGAGYTYALENSFIVSAQITSLDVNAPSVPTSVAASPVSTGQINVSWDASSDNIAVAGYRVYRDGIFVATTTVESYSDIGLNPATTYGYTVDAFDAAFNFSAQSATTTATTFSPPASNDDNGGGRSSSRRGEAANQTSIAFVMENVLIETHETYAEISWTTTEYARMQAYWGETLDYEGGTISGVVYQKSHIIKIENLLPDTEYFFKIDLLSNDGKLIEYKNKFTTRSIPGSSIPESIFFTAHAAGTSVLLEWSGKSVKEGERVRIVRSEKFFPIDPYDGKVVYEGARGSDFVDKNLEEGKTYYYALFIVDADDQYSSGSLAKAEVNPESTEDIFLDIPYSDAYEDILRTLTFADFDFIQKGEKLSFSGGGLRLSGDLSTEVRISADLIPLGIKGIAVTFTPQEANARSMTFLLNRTKDGLTYRGVMEALHTNAVYEVEINIFDTSNNKVKTLHAIAQVDSQIVPLERESFVQRFIEYVKENIVIILMLLVIGFIGGLMARRL